MKTQLPVNQSVLTYNEQVQKAYLQILKQTKSLLSTLEEEPLRYTLTREDKLPKDKCQIIHELVSPLIYLRLESHENGEYSIHYGYEQSPCFGAYYPITSAFVRMVYRFTMANQTEINIEEAVRVDWVIDNCSELYEHVEERKKHHTFKLLKHKPKLVKRKLLSVA